MWSNPPVVATALTCLIASEFGHDCGSCVCVCVCTLIGFLRWYALERVSGEIHLIMSPVKPRQPYMYMYTYYMHMIHVHAHVNLSVCTMYMYIIPRVQHKQECTLFSFDKELISSIWNFDLRDAHFWWWWTQATEEPWRVWMAINEATNHGREPYSLLNYHTWLMSDSEHLSPFIKTNYSNECNYVEY